MKILHTSDWHLGRSLYGKKRYEEFAAFLDWLVQTIKAESIDTLLIAGDVFDTTTPSNRAQSLYYSFLCQVSRTCCRHIVIIGGNHDSPSFLNAPKELLLALNVYVVGAITDSLADEVIVLHHGDQPQAIICAVPYLRDKDIRTAEPGESIDDKNAKLVYGLKHHYQQVCAIAEQKRAEFQQAGYKHMPIIGMGHLFTAGGKTLDGDGVRDLYVGSLAHVTKDIFPVSIDYLALGHLHVPQAVGGAAHIRYSGSPIPMGFGEAKQAKQVVLIDFAQSIPNIQELPIPCFQKLVRIKGSLEHIQHTLEALKNDSSHAWLEIEYTGNNLLPHLRELIDDALVDTQMEIRRIKNRSTSARVMQLVNTDESLDNLNPTDIFQRCLDSFEIPAENREELTMSYDEIVKALKETDANAE